MILESIARGSASVIFFMSELDLFQIADAGVGAEAGMMPDAGVGSGVKVIKNF